MDPLFKKVSYKTSKLVTLSYSTSFSIGVKCLHPSLRDAIYSIYGFVRFADEIVDSFHEYDKERLLNKFIEDYYDALNTGISLNPVLNSFQETVKSYGIEDELVQAFLKSMKSDLQKTNYTETEIKEYIFGSADVVGLMCLKIFVSGNKDLYKKNMNYAMRLGTAFQKINFLRDIGQDTMGLHRIYFPVLNEKQLNEETKNQILKEISEDFKYAAKGIKQLPSKAKWGVYVAYFYYLALTRRITKTKAEQLEFTRISVPSAEKIYFLIKAYFYYKFC